jgi:hypothetical protein
VEAGSIPYSAVSQPRPWPAIQRGTDSCTEAVQITRVSPHEISALPVAGRTKFALDRDRPEVGRPAAAAALAAHAAALWRRSTCSTGPSGICRKRVPRRGERLDVAGGEEGVVALAAGRVAEPAGAEHVLDLRASGAPDVTISTPRPSVRWSIGRTSG